MKRIGLLGCGAIGTEIAKSIDSGKIPAKLTHLYDAKNEVSIGFPIVVNSVQVGLQIMVNLHVAPSNSNVCNDFAKT